MINHVLITGGLGFIGHHLVKKFLDMDYYVTVLDNLSNHVGHAALTKYRLEYIDHKKVNFVNSSCLMSFAIREKIKTPPQLIIHLAAYPNQAAVANNKINAISSMSSDTSSMLDLAGEYNSKFVYVSSSMTYGNFTQDPMPESQPLKPINLYGLLKKHSEELVKLTSSNYVIVRPSAVYGPGDNRNRVIAKWINAALNDDMIYVNDDSAALDFTHVRDLANGIYAAAIYGPAGETFNLTYGHARTLVYAAQMIKHMTKSSSTLAIVNDRKTDDPQRGSLDINHARKTIGFNPIITLEQGLEDYINWIIRHKHVY